MATVVENLTDGDTKKDRTRLAKERRQEKDKSQAVREQALLEKQQRAQQQYQRSLMERGRRLEEQRQREALRRSAVEEKRRQRIDDEKTVTWEERENDTKRVTEGEQAREREGRQGPPRLALLQKGSDSSVRESLFFPVSERNEQERLELLMRRSLDRNLQVDQRPKRWTWCGPPGACDGDPKIAPPCSPASASLANDHAVHSPAGKSRNAVQGFLIPPESPDSLLNRHLSSSSATLPNITERGKSSSSPHRSPYRGSPSRAERKKVSASFCGPLDDSRGAATSPKTPQTERSIVQTLSDSTMKKLESPTTPTHSFSTRKNPSTPKRSKSCKSRIQSPASPGQFPPSPMRHRATTPSGEGRRWDADEKERKTSRTEKMPKSNSKEFGHNAGDMDGWTKCLQSCVSESPVTPTGKAGTTDAEEASRLLAERRRLAREQREQEEKQERLRAAELQRQQDEERERKEKEKAARQEEEQRQALEKAEEDRQQQERADEKRLSYHREPEERDYKEQRWKELQDDLERQREEAVQRVHREAERKRQERELLKVQEEQERFQRKKRIEEIMKRTRKPDGEKKEEAQMEVPSPISGPQSISPSPLETEVSKVISSPLKAAFESPIICLHPLEGKSCVSDDLSDGVQSMDVSENSHNRVSSVALGDILVLAGHVSHPKVSAAPGFGDCNKNLIRDCSSTAIDSSLFQSIRPTSDKLNI
ncbi:hypothetical protein DNTS_015367 [Danionella cerebrum]|uniref:MAP7 domain-containing protein 2 n=1 Tax=Danionella cerebrum TaxID=2873325 RepID=A0A553NWV2_9TELE|nr:hypothetical protein DNTS_015367 [Danionella translucida]